MIKRITYLIVFAISMSLWSCSEKAQQGEAALELLVYHYEHEDVNPLKVEMVRYFAENIRWHYTLKGEVTTADIESITYDFCESISTIYITYGRHRLIPKISILRISKSICCLTMHVRASAPI